MLNTSNTGSREAVAGWPNSHTGTSTGTCCPATGTTDAHRGHTLDISINRTNLTRSSS